MSLQILTVVVAGYVLVTGYLGWLGFRHTRGAADYLVGGRETHPVLMALAYGSTFISTSAIVGFGGAAALFGMGLLWLTALNILVGVFIAFVVFGRPTRRLGVALDAHTFPELLGRRFQSRFIQGLTGGTIATLMPLYAAAVLIGGARFVEVQLDMDYHTALLVFATITVGYVLFGGLKGVIYTDAFQGVIMLAGMVTLLVVTYATLGGLSSHSALTALAAQVPPGLAAQGHRGWTAMPVPGSPMWWQLVSTIILGVGIGVLAQPQLTVRFMTVKSDRDLHRALVPGGLFILMMTGVAFVVGALSNLYLLEGEGPDRARRGRRSGDGRAEHRQGHPDVRRRGHAGVVRVSVHAHPARGSHVDALRAVPRDRDGHRARPVWRGAGARASPRAHGANREGRHRGRVRGDGGARAQPAAGCGGNRHILVLRRLRGGIPARVRGGAVLAARHAGGGDRRHGHRHRLVGAVGAVRASTRVGGAWPGGGALRHTEPGGGDHLGCGRSDRHCAAGLIDCHGCRIAADVRACGVVNGGDVSESAPYVIRGGVAGRERLRTLARVMHASTSTLLDRLGELPGMRCLDAGCGGGDVTRELARRVGPTGRVLGVDVDDTKIALAQGEAEAGGLTNVEFRRARIGGDEIEGPFDLVYSRFLLTHLPDPHAAVALFHRLLRPDGLIALEDIDFSGYLVYPESEAHRRYVDLYCGAVRHNGADPDIGPKLPSLLKKHQFTDVGVSVSQPTGLHGDVKLITAMTMENIADAVVGAGLASPEEVASLVQQLYADAADPDTLAGMPRVVQVWART